MKSLPLTQPFSLHETLVSGQFFQWQPYRDGYLLQTGGKVFFLFQQDNTLHYEGINTEISPEFLNHFFRLDEDIDQVFKQWNYDPFLTEIYQQYRGLRLLRQDPWECTLGFLLSMASNIPRITGNILTIQQKYGRSVRYQDTRIYLTPPPDQLSHLTVEALYELGIGFRAKYLHQLLRTLQTDPGVIENLRPLTYPEAKVELTGFYGIGDKVADCVLLFSLDQTEAFPTDTWIIKVLHQHYFSPQIRNPSALAALARKRFGKYAGYAQQYLFHYARMGQ